MALASPGAASNRTVDDPGSCVTVAATDRTGVASATAAAAMHGAAIRLRPRPSISTTSLQENRSYSSIHLPTDGETMLLPSVYRHTIHLC